MAQIMTNTPQPIRGTQSLIGEDADRFHAVIAAFDRVRRLYGFKRIEVPVIEPTAVFARTMGETTDVVSKEMYSFDDRSGDSITLRPEFTAGIARAYLSEGWQQFAPFKVATHGPAFRYERPQKGRFRQFHQLDAEIIGAGEPQADVELLAFGSQLLAELGIDGVTLKLNTLGDAESRDRWRAQLVEHFASHRAELSEDSQARLDKNPLRILDSKDARDRPFAASAPSMTLTGEAEDFFGQVRAGLDAAGVAYELAPHLVRGLDYYRHTAFEFVTDRLGAQGHGDRRRPLRWPDRATRRPAYAGGRLGGGDRATGDADRGTWPRTPLDVVIPDNAETEADAVRCHRLHFDGPVSSLNLASRGNAKQALRQGAERAVQWRSRSTAIWSSWNS